MSKYNKEYQKEYYLKNIERIKEYRLKNKEHTKEQKSLLQTREHSISR